MDVVGCRTECSAFEGVAGPFFFFPPARPTLSTSGLLTKGTLQSIGIDLIDTSSGGTWIKAQIPVAPGYQGSVLSSLLALLPLSQLTIAPSGPVPFAAQIKKAVPDVLVGAVGLLTSASQIENVLRAGQADVVFVAREVLRNSDFVRLFLFFVLPPGLFLTTVRDCHTDSPARVFSCTGTRLRRRVWRRRPARCPVLARMDKDA